MIIETLFVVLTALGATLVVFPTSVILSGGGGGEEGLAMGQMFMGFCILLFVFKFGGI